MHGDSPEGFLPCAVCVQRFGNWMVLQLIPLIALYCVLQRNRKPSHPSRHVVGAVLHTPTHTRGSMSVVCVFVSSGKKRNVLFLVCVYE